jgi:hypothetical protein
MTGRARVLALTAALLVAAPPAADALEFADWTATGGSLATGTLLGHPISLSGWRLSDLPPSYLDGTSPLFAAPYFTPPLAQSDVIEFRSEYGVEHAYTLDLGAPALDPTLQLGSLGTTLQFPAGTSITRVSSKDAGFAVSGSTVSGAGDVAVDSYGLNDSNGTIRLNGVFPSIVFTATTAYALDGVALQVGASPVPVTLTPGTGTGSQDALGDSTATSGPAAGVRVVAARVGGRVLVRQPAGDFVPLPAGAELPPGAVVDARKGRIAVRSAAAGRGVHQATLAAGIFRIRAQRARAGATDVLLVTPPGRSRACASRRRQRARSTVRRLLVRVEKGVFRTVGAKSAAKGRNATWTTADRCDGTLTRVRRGRVSVRTGRRTIRLAAGGRHVAKGRPFRGS